MELQVPKLMEDNLSKQLEDDMRRLLAGTDIRADGSAITADSLDANIKNLFAGGFYEAPKQTGNFEPTVSGVNQSASVKQSSGNGNGGPPAKTKNNPDISLPSGLQKLTGAKTVGEFLGQGVQTVIGGALTAVNPIAGLAFKGVLNVAKGATVGDTVADIATSLNPFSSIGVKALGAIGAFDKAEGLMTSASDAYQTLNTLDHVPTTKAGRNVINQQVEAAKQATGHYDSSRNVQQRASTAALNRDQAPAYARPGYGTSLANASNPAKAPASTPSNSSSKGSSYQQAGQIGSTKPDQGHAPAGGVGPSPSKGGSNNGGKNSSGSSGGGSSGSKGSSSSSSSGGSRGNGKTGSGSYGGR